VSWRVFPPLTAPYRGTSQTVASMRALALGAQTSWPLRRLVEKICLHLRPKDYLSELLALFHVVCRAVRYMRDPRTVELVKTPEATLATSVGDCDDMATLLAALLLLAGFLVRFVTVGFRSDGSFTHVYVEAFEPRRQRWVALDPVAGPRTAAMLARTKSARIYRVD
jgi:transglutaminase-like putative cysteine protease